MAKSLPPRDHAISILRSAIGAIAEDIALSAVSTEQRDKNGGALRDAAHDIEKLVSACDVLVRRFSRHGL